MPDTHPTSPAHRTHSSSHRHEASRYIHTNYLDPVLYFSSAILLLLFAKLLHTGMLSPATGVLAIIVLAISKIWKFKPGIRNGHPVKTRMSAPLVFALKS